ncbi:MAG: bifunctional riboflavin kinase/FAD synthetase [Chloroflexota bacterium]|nr:bifunctional riboflavin kinase/FAD synthetase [Chloroflexota bacterium]
MNMLKDSYDLENTIDFFKLPPLSYEKTCITIGNFDGVHLGHQAIISQMVEQANSNGKPLIVITFLPNPFDFFNPDIQSFYLSTPKEKKRRLLGLGVDQVLTFKFDRSFANLTPDEFLSGLKDKLALETLVVGEDFTLGRNRQGTIPVLRNIGERLSLKIKVLPSVKLGNRDISSTKVRKLLDQGEVGKAADLLGRYYSISGVVTHGSDRGAKIGLPTANITYPPKKKLSAIGVYATYVDLRGEKHQGITNVGYRPTFENQATVNIETFIFDFSDNIYGEKMKLSFVAKIREEQKFSGVDEFLAQIERDKARARRIFKDDEK